MEKRVINSFGSITIPSRIRKELGIEGSSMVWVDVREGKGGKKEIVLKKKEDVESVFERYKTWAEVLSRIAESAVSIVWNNFVISLSSEKSTDSFISKNLSVSAMLSLGFKQANSESVVIKNPKEMVFLSNGLGNVSAFFKIKNTGDDVGYFVVVKGTKQYEDIKISKLDEMKRYNIIKDIVEKI